MTFERLGEAARSGWNTVLRVVYIAALLLFVLVAVVFLLALPSPYDFVELTNAVFETQPNLGAALVGLIAACIAVDSLQQKRSADDRNALLSRFQWAMELTGSGDQAEEDLGWRILQDLVSSPRLYSDDPVIIRGLEKAT